MLRRSPSPRPQLRNLSAAWHLADDLPEGESELLLAGGARLPVPDVHGAFVELELELLPARDDGGDGTSSASPRCTASGVLLHSWRGGAEGGCALLYHWDSGVLEAVFEALDPATLTFSLAAPGARRVGGKLLRPPALGQPLQLRLFLDYSLMEVGAGKGRTEGRESQGRKL